MEKFFEEIKNLIPNDYDEFLKCYNEEPYKGLRVNTLKCTGEKLQSLLDFPLKKTPFCDNGYYYPNEEKGLGKSTSSCRCFLYSRTISHFGSTYAWCRRR